MLDYLKQYAGTHVFYLVVIAVSLVAFRSWREEHDARLLAEQQIKTSDAAVKASQQEVTSLKQSIAENDARAVQQLASLQKIVAAVKTPQQAAAQIPQLVPNLPSPVTVQPDDSITFPKDDVLPLFQDLADAKVCTVKLAQCQEDYASEEEIAIQKDAQLTDREKEITALKQPRSFWHRVAGGLKQVGIGIGIGALLARGI